MSRRRKSSGEEESNEIDLTPMLDVVFIMLIFFIVTASFVKEIGLDVNLPPETQAEASEPENILIKVSSSDEIYVDDRRVDPRSVKAIIQTKHAEQPEASVVINADAEATAASYVAIADAAKNVGVSASLVMADKDK